MTGLALLLLGFLAIIAARTALASRKPAIDPLKTANPSVDIAKASAHLGEAIRLPTISRAAPAGSSEVFARFHSWLEQSYPHVHAAMRREQLAGGTLYYNWSGRDRSLAPIILMAHQDVVPADDARRWARPPFKGRNEADAIWGRGAIDDKSSLVAIMEAAESLASRGFTPRRGIILIFGHDEEQGGSGARTAAARLKSQGVRPWFVLDEGSLVVRDHPVTGQPAAMVGVSEKGYLTVRIVAKSKGGHASAPPDDSAVATIAKAVTAISQTPFERRYRGATRQMLETLASEAPLTTRLAIANPWLFEGLLRDTIGSTPQGAAMLHTTIAPTMLQGASRENILPSTASVTLNLRLDPEDSVETALAHLREGTKDLPVTLEIVGQPQPPSPQARTDTESYRFLTRAIQGHFAVPVVPAPVIAMTDGRAMQAICANVYRFQPIMLSLDETSMMHGLDEHISRKDFARMIAFYQSVIKGASAEGLPH